MSYLLSSPGPVWINRAELNCTGSRDWVPVQVQVLEPCTLVAYRYYLLDLHIIHNTVHTNRYRASTAESVVVLRGTRYRKQHSTSRIPLTVSELINVISQNMKLAISARFRELIH